MKRLTKSILRYVFQSTLFNYEERNKIDDEIKRLCDKFQSTLFNYEERNMKMESFCQV